MPGMHVRPACTYAPAIPAVLAVKHSVPAFCVHLKQGSHAVAHSPHSPALQQPCHRPCPAVHRPACMIDDHVATPPPTPTLLAAQWRPSCKLSTRRVCGLMTAPACSCEGATGGSRVQGGGGEAAAASAAAGARLLLRRPPAAVAAGRSTINRAFASHELARCGTHRYAYRGVKDGFAWRDGGGDGEGV